jgi:hypothetical protein
VLAVIFEVVRKDKNVVNIRCTENVKKRAEYFVDSGLESRWGVKEAKGHYKGFKETVAGVKCRYLFLAFFYPDSVKRVNNVKLSIELSCTKLRERFLEKRKRVTVLDRDRI